MVRRRSVPWIQQYSRFIIAAICVIGLIITTYLTVNAFGDTNVACPVDPATGESSCDTVLNSPYAKLFGLPLSLYGLLAYLGMLALALAPLLFNNSKDKKLRNQVEDITWQLLFIGGTAMAVFSGYLMYIAFGVLQATCYYCIASALCSLSLFMMSIIGRVWDEIGPLLFRGIIIGLVTLVATIGLYANANPDAQADLAPDGRIYAPAAVGRPEPPKGWEITTTSGGAEIALAQHLAEVGATEYAAFWCPFCYMQKQLFGKEAANIIPNVECDPNGIDGNPQGCSDAGVRAFPTWIINGEKYEGLLMLEQLAEITNYQGPMDFKYTPGKVSH
jgi:uncharacterized membrane protein